MTAYVVRPAEVRDLPVIVNIRNDAVDNGVALWTDQRTDLESAGQWVASTQAAGRAFIVAEVDGAAVDGAAVAYATYGLWRPQVSGYALTVEDSVYIADGHRGQGIGRMLLTALIEHARSAGMHVMVADIEAGNTASVRLHEQLGFHLDGTLPHVGTKFGRWLDLALMSLVLSDAPAPDRL